MPVHEAGFANVVPHSASTEATSAILFSVSRFLMYGKVLDHPHDHDGRRRRLKNYSCKRQSVGH
jgi:hypothetical protein